MNYNNLYTRLLLIASDMYIRTEPLEDNDAPYRCFPDNGLIKINLNNGIRKAAESFRDGIADIMVTACLNDRNAVYKQCIAQSLECIAQITDILAVNLPEEEAIEALEFIKFIFDYVKVH